MDRNEAIEIIKRQLTEKRFIHTLGVVDSAVELAKRYGADIRKAEIAAIFHDYAKFRSKQEMVDIIKREAIPDDLLDYGSELWHAPVGAFLVQKEVGISDEKILQAIRFHTTGRANMSLLEKIVFLADYIEPNRSFPGVDEVRDLAKTDLNQALIKAIGNTIRFLIEKNERIYPETVAAYNDLLQED